MNRTLETSPHVMGRDGGDVIVPVRLLYVCSILIDTLMFSSSVSSEMSGVPFLNHCFVGD